MGIDWFTFVAQIINFIVLVILLKRFLYQPIMRVMEQRKQKIKSSLLEAEEKIIQAENEGKKYRDLTEKLEKQQGEILEKAKLEAEQERTNLIQKNRQEIEEMQSQWYRNLAQEREKFIDDFRQRTGQEIYQLLKMSLKDLANVELEQHLIEVFLERLQNLEQTQKSKICQSLEETEANVIVQTAFQLSEAQQEKIREAIEIELKTGLKIDFEMIPELICGIKLIAVGQAIAWNLETYLQNLEERFNQALLSIEN